MTSELLLWLNQSYCTYSVVSVAFLSPYILSPCTSTDTLSWSLCVYKLLCFNQDKLDCCPSCHTSYTTTHDSGEYTDNGLIVSMKLNIIWLIDTPRRVDGTCYSTWSWRLQVSGIIMKLVSVFLFLLIPGICKGQSSAGVLQLLVVLNVQGGHGVPRWGRGIEILRAAQLAVERINEEASQGHRQNFEGVSFSTKVPKCVQCCFYIKWEILSSCSALVGQ